MGALTSAIPEGTLPSSILEHPAMTLVASTILKVIIGSGVKSVRSSALQLLPLMLKRLEYKGRYNFLLYLIKGASHAGVAGYACGLLKDEIHSNLQRTPPTTCFLAPSLQKLLSCALNLPNGATS